MRRGIAAVSTLAVVLASACTPSDGVEPTISPSPTEASTAAPTPSATAEPTPADGSAEGTFVDYWRALDVATNRGGADHLPSQLARFLTGSERSYQERNLFQLKQGGFAGTGYGKVKLLGTTGSSDRVELSACVDQTARQITKNGEPYRKAPRYLLVSSAQMQRLNGEWKVAEVITGPVDEGLTCDNYS